MLRPRWTLNFSERSIAPHLPREWSATVAKETSGIASEPMRFSLSAIDLGAGLNPRATLTNLAEAG